MYSGTYTILFQVITSLVLLCSFNEPPVSHSRALWDHFSVLHFAVVLLHSFFHFFYLFLTFTRSFSHTLSLFIPHSSFFTLSLHFFSLQIMHYAVIFEENSKPHQIFCQHFSVKLTFSIILIHSCNFSTIPVHVALLFSIPSHQLLGCFVEYFIVTEMVCDNNFHFRQTASNELEME